MLPLRPFEEYMLLDDRDIYPMSFFIRLRFSGELDEDSVRPAFHRAAARHPLLNSVVTEPKKERFYWVPSETKPEFLRFETDDPDRLPHTPRIDLTREPGLRLYFIRRRLSDGAKTTELLFQVHHACCDGLGLMQLIDDFLRHYASEIGEADSGVVLPPPDPRTLKKRGTHALTPRYVLRRLLAAPGRLVGLHAFIRTYIDTPTSLVPMSLDRLRPTLPDSFPSVVCRTLGPKDCAALLDAARRRGVTLNDLLMRDLFSALGMFRNKYFAEKSHRLLRLSVPVNLRPFSTATDHVANIVGMVFVDRHVPRDGDPDALLDGLCREMRRNKFFRNGSTLNWVLRVCKAVPGLLAVGIHRKRRVWASCVFSNLGRILDDSPLPKVDGRLRFGDTLLDAIDCMPPVRAWTAAALGVVTYAGSMFLTLHYDTQFLDRPQAEELQDYLIRCLTAGLREGQ